jgi:pyruvate dehydrogenase E2 component (dihydrolipoamide acetyltransferase)
MTEVTMPRLSDSMEEGTILKWLVADGDEVARGDEIAEIETDKATMTYEADAAGALHLIAAEGDTLPVGAPIARIGAPGEAPPQRAPADGASADGAAPASSAPAAPSPAPATATARAGGGGTAVADAPPAGNGSASPARVKASPLARRVARDLGIDLDALEGSGPGGRIVRADVERAHAQPAAAPQPEPAAEAAPAGRGEVTVEELSRTQQVIARRMAESRATVPEFTLSTLVDMDACVRLRGELKEAALDPTPSYNDLVIKACALALREHPRANGSYKDGRFELYGRVNVGMAVAAQDALVVPTVFDADRRSLGDIARTTRGLAARVREGVITPPELSGGTFSVSNLGMFGVTDFQAVINAPQAAILAVGALREEPVVRDGRVVAGHVMGITLSCDHRILYGADAAQFLARVRELLERPLALLAG